MSQPRVLKWTVPVDDQPHPIGAGPVVLVGCQESIDRVQVWTLETERGNAVPTRTVQVYGTGHALPDGTGIGRHVGSTQAGPLVWHVFQVSP